MRVLLLLVGASLLALSAAAEHSYSPCPSNITPIGTGNAILYLIEDPEYGTWIFAETNGHPWVQRGGNPWYDFGTGGYFDPCWDIDRASGWEIEDPDRIVL